MTRCHCEDQRVNFVSLWDPLTSGSATEAGKHLSYSHDDPRDMWKTSQDLRLSLL